MKMIRQKKMLKMGALFMVMVMSIVSLCATGTAEALSPASDASIAIAGISMTTDTFRAYNVSLSGGSVSGLPSGTNEAATSIPTSHIMFKNSYSSSKPNNVTIAAPAHYLIFQADANSALQGGTSVTELGCLSFSWDVYLNSDLTKVATGVKKSVTRQYTVSHI